MAPERTSGCCLHNSGLISAQSGRNSTLSALCISACRMGARPLALTLLRLFKHKELRENASWRNWKRYLSTYLSGDKCYRPSCFPRGSDGKESTCNAGDLGSIPGLVRSPGEGNGNPLQCSCLENPRDGRAWWAASMGSHRVRHDWSDLAVAVYRWYIKKWLLLSRMAL